MSKTAESELLQSTKQNLQHAKLRIDDLMKDILSKDMEIIDLKETLVSSQQTTAALQEQLDKSNETLKETLKMLDATESKLGDKLNKILQLNNIINLKNRELAEYTEAFEKSVIDHKSEIDVLIAKLTTTDAFLEKNTITYEEEIESLSQIINKMATESEFIHINERQKFEENITKIQDGNQKLQESLDDLQKHFDSLIEENGRKDVQIMLLSSQLEERQRIVAKLDEDKCMLSEELTEVKTYLEEGRQTTESLSIRIPQLSKSIEEARKQCKQQTPSLSGNEKNLASIHSELTQKEASIQEKCTIIEHKQIVINRLTEKLQSITDNKTKLSSELDIANELIIEKQKQFNEQTLLLNVAQQDFTKVHLDITKKQNPNDKNCKIINDMHITIGNLTGKLQTTKDDLITEVDEIRKKYQDLRELCDGIEDVKAGLKNYMKSLEADVDSLNSKLHEEKKLHNNKTTACEENQTTIHTQKKQISQKQKLFETLEEDVMKLSTIIKDNNNRNVQLQELLLKKTEELRELSKKYDDMEAEFRREIEELLINERTKNAILLSELDDVKEKNYSLLNKFSRWI
ncbi:hypothetical protein SNE40_019819 [Patella caerulea]